MKPNTKIFKIIKGIATIIGLFSILNNRRKTKPGEIIKPVTRVYAMS